MSRALAVIVLASLAVAGCGGASARKARVEHSGATVAAVGDTPHRLGGSPHSYRWLVPTGGAQPSVAAENSHGGTTSWRLSGPAEDVGGLARGSVVGYVAEQALRPGQTQRIYVNAPGARHIRIRIYRMGWYGGTGGREVLVSGSLPAVVQPPCTHRFATGLTECRWHPALSFTVPPALPSGVFIVRLSATTGESDCLFVVRAAHPQPLLAQLPTLTYEAYNAWGGDSLYPGGADEVGATGTTQGVEVSYDRPYATATGAGQFFARDVAMVRFLERYRYPVSYTTSESVDQDPGQLIGHKALIDFGHSEYWSQRQANGFAHARDDATSLLFFGSDTLAWRVRYASASRAASEAGQPDHSIVSYKQYAALDPNHADPTGPFPDGGASLSGSAYLGCITPRLLQPGPPTYRYYTWAPAQGLRPSWLFAGAGLDATSQISGIVGYELDQRTPSSPPGTQIVGSGGGACIAAESATSVSVVSDQLAETTIYTTRAGALVFNTGTLGWELGLEPVPSASPDAPRHPDRSIVVITRNLLAHVLERGRRRAPDAAPNRRLKINVAIDEAQRPATW